MRPLFNFPLHSIPYMVLVCLELLSIVKVQKTGHILLCSDLLFPVFCVLPLVIFVPTYCTVEVLTIYCSLWLTLEESAGPFGRGSLQRFTAFHFVNIALTSNPDKLLSSQQFSTLRCNS